MSSHLHPFMRGNSLTMNLSLSLSLSLFVCVSPFSPKKDGLRLNNQPLSSYGLTWNTVPGTDLVVGYVKQYNANSTLMTMHHVNDDVFNVHVTTAKECESKTMPLTYGKPLLPVSVSGPC